MGELEEQLKETEEERLKRETAMKAELDAANSKISKLELELRKALEDVHQLRRANSRTEELLEAEKREKEELRTELHYLRAGAKSSGTDAVALPPRRTRKQTQIAQMAKQASLQQSQQQQQQNQIAAAASSLLPIMKREPESQSPPASHPHPLGCGTCSSTSRCACVEQVITFTAACGRCRSDSVCTCVDEPPNTHSISMNTALMPDLDMKRAFASSSPISSHKRPRISVEDDVREIDFTAVFSRPAPTTAISQREQQQHREQQREQISHREEVVRDYIDLTTARPPPGETCGFCDDSTYCACAEAAAAQARDRELENQTLLPPMVGMNEVTPPPSDSDGPTPSYNNSEYKLPSLYPNHRIYQSAPTLQSKPAASNSCANGPGTCQQCQDDPKSGLFCRSLAAIRAQNPSFSGCCGNGGPGGCCKDDSSKSAAPPSAPRPSSAVPVRGEVKLSCAETYKTLASHAHFDDAAGQLGEWLPKLAALPRREEGGGNGRENSAMYPGRGAMDIDAASVMSVIKYFDVRFGRE